MPYNYPDNIPKVAQNWDAEAQRKCTAAAQAALESGSSEAEAIFACIAAAGKSKHERMSALRQTQDTAFWGRLADAVADRLGLERFGGPGSGHWGHKGIPGQRGGSAGGGGLKLTGAAAPSDSKLGQFDDLDEARRWAEDRYPHVKWDFEGAHIDTINPSLKQFDTLAKEYPEVASKLTYVGTLQGGEFAGRDAWKNAGGAYAFASADGSMIGLNPTFYSDPAGFKLELKTGTALEARAGRWHPQGCDTVESVLSHEFGHSVFNEALRGDKGNTVYEWTMKNKATSSLSRYATTSPFEGFAEGFSALYHSPKSSHTAYVKRQAALLASLKGG